MVRTAAVSVCALAAIVMLACAGLWIWAKASDKPPLLEGVSFSRMVLDKNGALLRLGLAEDEIYRIRCELREIHPSIIRATLLYEDRWFYHHPGINPFSLLRAAASTYLGGTRRVGASTLTMQVARLRYKLHTGTVKGKLHQMLMALRLEAHYTKREILEAYCNLAPYGNNVEGVEAAARIYFHVPAARLSLAESIALAVTPQNPGKRTPLGNRHTGETEKTGLLAARERLAALWTLPILDEDAEPPGTALPGMDVPVSGDAFLSAPLQVYGPASLPFAAPHLTTALLRDTALPSPVRATLDARTQTLLERAVARYVESVSDVGIRNAAALLVHWPDMEVRSLAGSADFHDASIQGQVDVTAARRSPGSTLKPFIYALALDQGLIHPMTLLADTPRSFRGYDPENIDQRFQGPLPAHAALSRSRNVPAIGLAARLGYPGLYGFLRRAGVRFARSEEHYGLSLVLGGAEMTMRELAGLYAMLPNRGLWRPLRFVQAETPPPERMLSPEAAFITLDILRENERITSRAKGRDTRVSLYVKTGTSNGYRDAWCAGVFGPYALVVWLGNCDNSANPSLVGRTAAVPLFREIALSLAGSEAMEDNTPQAGEGNRVARLPVCTETGDTDTGLCPGRITETWFIPGVSPVAPTGILRRILLDAPSGLRACRETETTHEAVWEFWPGDMQRIFAMAGISKPPPPDWMPGCEAHASGEPLFSGTPEHTGLRITSPKQGVRYYARLSRPDAGAIPLTAASPADSKTLFWFAGARMLGKTGPGEPLMWTPPPGLTELRVVDDKGRSDTVRVRAESVE